MARFKIGVMTDSLRLPLPVEECLNTLQEIGYDGFLTIEREIGEDPIRDIKEAINFLKERV